MHFHLVQIQMFNVKTKTIAHWKFYFENGKLINEKKPARKRAKNPNENAMFNGIYSNFRKYLDPSNEKKQIEPINQIE